MDVASGTATIARANINNAMDTISANIQLNDDFIVSDANGSDSDSGQFSLHLSGNISGAGKSLTINGGGAVKLSGANTYSGGTTVNSTFFRFVPGSIGSGPLIISGNNSDICSGNLSLTNNEIFINGDFKSHYGFKTGYGFIRLSKSGIKMLASVDIQGVVTDASGTNTLNALDINLGGINGWGATPTISCTVTMRSDQTMTHDSGWTGGTWPNAFSGAISDGGNGFSLTKAGNATTVMKGTNTYSGDTIISGGGLVVGNNLTFVNSALSTSAGKFGLDTGVTTPTFGGLKGSTDLASTFMYNNDSGNSYSKYGSVTALSLNPLAGHSNTYSGYIADGAAGMKLIKTGAGVQVLAGANTYTGDTTVSNGTLLVNGSVTGTVMVASGGGFGGTGTVYGAVTYSPGAMAVFTHGSPMTITGSLVLNTNVVHLILPELVSAGTYTLATFNPTDSSGEFTRTAVIDSGAAVSAPLIMMGTGIVIMKVPAKGTVITIR